MKYLLTTTLLSILALGCGEFEDDTHSMSDDHPIDYESADLELTEKGAFLRSAVWNKKKIKVCWENPKKIKAKHRALVRHAIKETWEKEVSLKFVDWGSCKNSVGYVRIRGADVGPHVKRLGKHLNGVRDGMVLNFTFKDWGQACRYMKEKCIKAIAVHEFGHALGITHEQNRHDTPASCTKPAQGTTGDVNVGSWDPHSVMNYCNAKYANNGKLSKGDKKTVKKAYKHLR